MPEFIPVSRGEQTVLCLPGLDGSRALVQRLVGVLDGEVTIRWADYNAVRGLTYPRAVAALEREVAEHAPVAILAESFGSTVAISWALEHPAHRIPLILSGPLSVTRRHHSTRWGRFAAWAVPARLHPLCVWLGGKVFIGRNCAPEVRQALRRDFCAIPRHAWLDRLAMLLEVDLRERLKELRAPVRLIWFERDGVVIGDEEAEVFRAAGLGEGIRILPGMGHSVWANAPEVVAEELRRHLNGHGPQ